MSITAVGKVRSVVAIQASHRISATAILGLLCAVLLALGGGASAQGRPEGRGGGPRLHARIDLLPNDPENVVDPLHGDRVAVAIYGSAELEVRRLDPESLRLEGTAVSKDESGRLAIFEDVDRETNPSFHTILTAYRRRTGIPSVLNTSFNIHEEPIACFPSDAVQTFLAGDLDYLALEDLLVSRS